MAKAVPDRLVPVLPGLHHQMLLKTLFYPYCLLIEHEFGATQNQWGFEFVWCVFDGLNRLGRKVRGTGFGYGRWVLDIGHKTGEASGTNGGGKIKTIDEVVWIELGCLCVFVVVWCQALIKGHACLFEEA